MATGFASGSVRWSGRSICRLVPWKLCASSQFFPAIVGLLPGFAPIGVDGEFSDRAGGTVALRQV